MTFLQLWGDDSISDSVIFPWKAGGRSHTNMRVKVHLRFIFKVGIHTYCKVANSSTSHLVVVPAILTMLAYLIRASEWSFFDSVYDSFESRRSRHSKY